MTGIKNNKLCSGCSACAMICPHKCITMSNDTWGFMYPAVEAEKCVNCGLCEVICPDLQNALQKSDRIPEAYIAMGKDDVIREKSSSGGVFSLLAQQVLSQGGVVFGAAFDDGFHSVNHIAVETVQELEKLRGSKYVQSTIGCSYADVKMHLEQGRVVLFSGTPCQISGLKAFLKKEYDTLYLQDIVCHGVPSPAVWDAYLQHLEERFGGKAMGVSFRDKKDGWKNYRISIAFDNGKTYSVAYADDLYMRGFLRNYYLRPSCYACKHKGLERESDITLADCWGVEDVCPELDDNKGTSLVIVSSPKGKRLFDGAANELRIKKVDVNSVLAYNQSIVRSASTPVEYDQFAQEFQQRRIENLLKKYCSVSIMRRIKKKLKSLRGKRRFGTSK